MKFFDNVICIEFGCIKVCFFESVFEFVEGGDFENDWFVVC